MGIVRIVNLSSWKVLRHVHFDQSQGAVICQNISPLIVQNRVTVII